MKIVAFEVDGEPAIGKVEGDYIVRLSGVVSGCPVTMIETIRRWDELKPSLEVASGPTLPIAEVVIKAPVPRPEKVLGIGLNYGDHAKESGIVPTDAQEWFCKQPSSINGPFDPIVIPLASDKIDYEVELVAVIGKSGRQIPSDRAHSHVFGYCVGNDVSARDLQFRTTQWMLGKSCDTHAPIGPWITTANEVGDPHRLGIRCYVNGQLRQSSNTCHLIHNVWQQIEHLSRIMTLVPGDLIFTGTPAGVGWAMRPPLLLRAGDVVRCEIDELGTIEGVLVADSLPSFVH